MSDSIPAAYAPELGDWRLMKTGWVDPRRRADATATQPRMRTISMTTLSQRVANAAAFSQTSTMLAMEPMLSHLLAHLKMPGPGAHLYSTVTLLARFRGLSTSVPRAHAV